MTQNDVKKVQNRLLEMAKTIRDIFECNKIPYFITYGTQLVAVRHGGFIPWDDDFDFYLFDDSYDDAMKVLSEDLPEDMFLENWNTEPKYFHDWAHVKDMHSCTECELFPQDGLYSHKGISIDLYRTKRVYEKEENVFRLSKQESYLRKRFEKGCIDKNTFEKRIGEVNDKLVVAKKELKEQTDLGREIFAFYLFYNDRLFTEEIYPLKRIKFEDTEFYAPQKPEALLERCYGDFMKLPPIEKRNPHYSSIIFF